MDVSSLLSTSLGFKNTSRPAQFVAVVAAIVGLGAYLYFGNGFGETDNGLVQALAVVGVVAAVGMTALRR